jgi:hypothetical protein
LKWDRSATPHLLSSNSPPKQLQPRISIHQPAHVICKDEPGEFGDEADERGGDNGVWEYLDDWMLA